MRGARCVVVVLSVAASLLVANVVAAVERPTMWVSPLPPCNPKAVVWHTLEPPAEAQAGDVWMNYKDDMKLVYVPPGEFTMGTSEAQIAAVRKLGSWATREWFRDEQPQFRARLDGYWIARTEVTNAQYFQFVRATGHRRPEHWINGEVPERLQDFPVVNVSWEDAQAYVAWAGGELPTEPLWEKAARGEDGRLFPWGDKWDRKNCRNYEEARPGLPIFDDRPHPIWGGPVEVGSYPSDFSLYGCFDMAGNVLEWCADRHDDNAYRRYAAGDLTPPQTGHRVMRGGSWFNDDLFHFRCAARGHAHPRSRMEILGFRYVRNVPGPR